MSGVRNVLLLLFCAVSVYDADILPPPTDIQISPLGLGRVNVSWRYTPPKKNIAYIVKVKTPKKEEKDGEEEEEEEEEGEEEGEEIPSCPPLYPLQEYPSETFFMYEWLAVPRGLRVEVAAIVMNKTDEGEVIEETGESASQELPPFPGDEGTAPTNINCSLQIDEPGRYWLCCDWLPGEKAPLDTKYYLYFRHMNGAQECLSYVTEPGGGRAIGCQTLFSDSSLKAVNFLVHINGSSRNRQIRATEHVYNINDAETIPPVWNLSMKENRSLSWMKPIRSMADICFNYQINIWSQDKSETITISKEQHYWKEDVWRSAGKRHVRVRAVGKSPCWQTEKYSSWTSWIEVLHIEEDSGDVLWISMTVCLFVACLALCLLCIRLWRKIFPQIPKPKDDLKDAFKSAQHQALIRCNSWDTEEVISYIEVMGGGDKQCGVPGDYGHITD
ncbi:interleukin-5 receptor subunit alpha [Lithobates pipiens]